MIRESECVREVAKQVLLFTYSPFYSNVKTTSTIGATDTSTTPETSLADFQVDCKSLSDFILSSVSLELFSSCDCHWLCLKSKALILNSRVFTNLEKTEDFGRFKVYTRVFKIVIGKPVCVCIQQWFRIGYKDAQY